MKEYIEREALVEEIKIKANTLHKLHNLYTDQSARVLDRLAEDIAKMPTSDVAPMIHGEWVEDGYYDNPCVCSVCGSEADYISRFNETFDYDWEENLQPTGYEEIKEYIRTPYCPFCGAKMDGGNQ